MKWIGFLAVFFAAPVSAQVVHMNCKLVENCTLGEGCLADGRDISWLQIDNRRIEILTADGYQTANLSRDVQVAQWQDGNTFFSLEFFERDRFLLTQYVAVPPTIEETNDGPLARFNLMHMRPSPRIHRIVVSTGRCPL